MPTNLIRKIVVGTAAFALPFAVALPAMASPGSGPVSGTLTVSPTMALSLDQSAVSATLAGGTGSFAPVTNATVSGNDGGGYSLTSTLSTQFKAGTFTIPNTDFNAAASGTGGSALQTYKADSSLTNPIASSSAVPSLSGDIYGVTWGYAGIPANQAAGAYAGAFTVVLVPA